MSSYAVDTVAISAPSAASTREGTMVEFDKNFEKDLQRQADEQLKRTIEIPDGMSEDDAVAFVIKTYKDDTGVDLDEAAVRESVREQMGGSATT